jgi:hypothetical protein
MRVSLANATPEELSGAWARAEPFIDAASELRAAFIEAARSRPFQAGPDRWVGAKERTREQLDSIVAFEAMASVLGSELAMRHVEMSVSKSDIERACAEFLATNPSATGSRAALVRAVLGAVRARDGVAVRTTTTVGIHAGALREGGE